MRLSVQLPFESYYLGATPPQIRMNTGFLLTFCTFPEQLMFNEWYAKDTSKKIRAVFRNKGMSGQRISTCSPYGYLRNEDGSLRVDEETAPNVRLIFQLCAEGNGPGKIARMLKEREIPTPGTLEFQRTGRTRRYRPDDPCRWTSDTIAGILEQDSYLGRTSNFKSSRISYKGKKKVENPPEKWVTFENTHEAIIDVDLWNAVQKIRSQRRRPTKMGEMGMFSGLAHCADCGAKLYHCRSGSLTYEQECYNCSTHKVHKGCFGHYIRAVVLEQLVLQNLQRVIAYVREDENEFARLVMRNQTAAQAAEQTQTRRLLEKNTRRMNELDTIIQRLYEDNISGKLTDERFKKLSEAYEQEQAALRESVPALAAQLQDMDDKMMNVQHFLKAVRKYTQPEKLTAAMLRELVEKVVVYAPDKSSGHRVQRIDVYYTFIGKIDFSPEYSKKGTA